MSYKLLECYSALVHIACFSIIFHLLEKRFIWIGYNYLFDVYSVNIIFQDVAYCHDEGYSSTGEFFLSRRSCHLNLQAYFQFSLLILWFLYLVGFIMHTINLIVNMVVLISCNEKRWVLNSCCYGNISQRGPFFYRYQAYWIGYDMRDWTAPLLDLCTHELFVLGFLSKHVEGDPFLRLLKRLKNPSMKIEEWEKCIA